MKSMGRHTKVAPLTLKRMGMESVFVRMVIDITGYSLTVRCASTESIIVLTGMYMRVNGSLMNLMEQELAVGQMEIVTKDIMKKERFKVEALFSLVTETNTMAI
jgi:hypothetical protein